MHVMSLRLRLFRCSLNVLIIRDKASKPDKITTLNHLTHEIYLNSYPRTGLDRPRSYRRFRLPGFSENLHMMVVGYSAVCNGHLYPQNRSLVLISVRG